MSRPKLTEPEKLARKVARYNKQQADKLPLLAYAGLDVGANSVAEHIAKAKLRAARAAQHWHGLLSKAAKGLVELRERRYYRLAVELIGEERARQLSDYAHRTYPAVDYWLIFWGDVFCGKRVVLELDSIPDPTPAIPWRRQVLEKLVYQASPPFFTREEWYALFPVDEWEAEPHQPDDGGVMELVEAAVARSKQWSSKSTVTAASAPSSS